MEEEINAAAARMLRAAGLPAAQSISPIPGGWNNRICRVDAGPARVLLKSYFRERDGQCDRLDREFSFLSFAWRNDIRCVPQPLARDDANGLGLYAFIDGSGISVGDIDDTLLGSAVAFFKDLNRYRNTAEARALSPAAEACLSIDEHLGCVDARLRQLTSVEDSCSVNAQAIDFVGNRLLPAWEKTVSDLRRRAVRLGLDCSATIPLSDRCLSPSDFGFHNALVSPDGQVSFLDFEYAGWDDPAKAVADFFCCAAVPVPFGYYDLVAREVAALTRDRAATLARIDLVLPVHRVKWCCLMLNEFLAAPARRRRFARGDRATAGEIKVAQLAKARAMLDGARPGHR